MGLDTTHDCWHGAYSIFHQWRQEIARAAGLPPLRLMEGFFVRGDHMDPLREWGERCPNLAESFYRSLPISWITLRPDPLFILLNHSDSDGEIDADDCGPIADRLEELLPDLPEGDNCGHIGNWKDKTQSFIDGLRAASAAGEPVEFH